MSRPLIPPKGVFIGTRIVYDPNLPAPVKETLLQLMALAWPNADHTTPPLSYRQLTHLTGKSDRTLRGHFLMLRTYQAALRLQPAGTGQFIVALAPWLFNNQVEMPQPRGGCGPAAGGKSLPAPDHDHAYINQEEAGLIGFIPDLEEMLPLPESDHRPKAGRSEADRSETARSETARSETGRSEAGRSEAGVPAEKSPARKPAALPAALRRRLEAAGVFPHLIADVPEQAARGGYTRAELAALLDWCQAENPQRPAGLFVYRLRQGIHAPAEMAEPACPRCGQRGKHAPECPHRYAFDG